MVMDPRLDEFLNTINGYRFSDPILTGQSGDGLVLPYPSLAVESRLEEDCVNFNISGSTSTHIPDQEFGNFVHFSPDGFSPSASSDSSDPVLKYINQMLMEEDMEETPFMLHDSLALHATEKSLYDVLCEYPSLPNQSTFYPDKSNGNSPNGFGEFRAPLLQTSPSATHHIPPLARSSRNFSNSLTGLVETSGGIQIPDIFSDANSILQFKRGVEEASKFLPATPNLVTDLGNFKPPQDPRQAASQMVTYTENDVREQLPVTSRGRKRDDIDIEEKRNNKQSAVYEDESELAEMFDKVLLCTGKKEPPSAELGNGAVRSLCTNEQSNSAKSHTKKEGSKKEVVDLRTLLILCAQAVSADDSRTANEILKQIRHHSSPSGDGPQRLAHYFANGIEARLDGTGTQAYSALASKITSAADVLKAYQVYIQACPFKKISFVFANQMILKAAKKAKTLHVIDFGILYGFQWPILIQDLSNRFSGSCKLRVTGIELPQAGFRPAERVEETGRRLERYCNRFNVPFEYNAVAQKWETIQIEDLKIDINEVVAVNCVYRLKNLLDESVMTNSPRDVVTNLIRKINPDIYVQAVVNGSYNAPFFVTRFREALFHFSSLYDMFDATMSRDVPERVMFEKEFYGREIMNVIACEGSERVERPETYKQWQLRNTRAGFRQLPLDPELMDKFRAKLKIWYHKDFVVDEDGHWMLLGWKGRIACASTCWVPV